MNSSPGSGTGRAGATGAGLGAGRAAGCFFGAALRAAGFLAGAFLSGLAFLRIAGFPAGAFLRLTLAFGFLFAAAMALSPEVCEVSILVAWTEHINAQGRGHSSRCAIEFA